MKLLRNRLFRFLLVLVLLVGMFSFKVYLEKQAINVETTKLVYVAAHELDSKKQIQQEDLKTINISVLSLPDNYSSDINELIGKFVVSPISKGSFVLSSNLATNKFFEKNMVPEGYKMVSVALKIDEAAGWKIEKEQIVDVVYSPFQYKPEGETILTYDYKREILQKNRVIEDVKIMDVINEALISTEEDEFAGVPKFVVFLVKDSDAEFIAMAKDKGRFDILIKSN